MQSFFTQENSPSSIFKVFSGFSLILTLSWFVMSAGLLLTAKFPGCKRDSLLLNTGGDFWGKENKNEGQYACEISLVKIIELRKGGFNKYQTIIIYDTFLLSTVLKPISDILGSFSPSSRPIKTFIASENIPRSVRTRTCSNERT